MTARSLVRRTGALAATLTLAGLAGIPLAGAASAAEPAAAPVAGVVAVAGSAVTAPAQEDTEEPPAGEPAEDVPPADEDPDATAPDGTDPEETAPEETAPEEAAAAPEATTPAAGAPAAAAAGRGSDLDCVDLSRAQAQAVLAADPSDPNNLDRDNDGRACEGSDLVAAAGTGQVRTVPGGGVEAGDGSGGAGVDPTVFLLVGTGAVLAAGAGAAVWSGRRTGRAALPLTTRHS